MRISEKKFPILFQKNPFLNCSVDLQPDLKEIFEGVINRYFHPPFPFIFTVSEKTGTEISKVASFVHEVLDTYFEKTKFMLLEKNGDILAVEFGEIILNQKTTRIIVVFNINGTQLKDAAIFARYLDEDKYQLIYALKRHDMKNNNYKYMFTAAICFHVWQKSAKVKFRKIGGKKHHRKIRQGNDRYFNESLYTVNVVDQSWDLDYSGSILVDRHPRMQACGPGWSKRKLIWISSHIRNYHRRSGKTKFETFKNKNKK